MKKFLVALVVLSTLVFAKIDVIEAMAMRVHEISPTSKISLQKVCVDGKLFVFAVTAEGASITQVWRRDGSIEVCKNGK